MKRKILSVVVPASLIVSSIASAESLDSEEKPKVSSEVIAASSEEIVDDVVTVPEEEGETPVGESVGDEEVTAPDDAEGTEEEPPIEEPVEGEEEVEAPGNSEGEGAEGVEAPTDEAVDNEEEGEKLIEEPVDEGEGEATSPEESDGTEEEEATAEDPVEDEKEVVVPKEELAPEEPVMLPEQIDTIEEPSLSILVNLDKVNLSHHPMVSGDNTFIPSEITFRIFQADTDWDEQSQTLTVKKGDTNIELVMGSSSAKINGEEVLMEVPATMIDSEIFVPLEWLCEVFDVSYAKDQNSININLSQ